MPTGAPQIAPSRCGWSWNLNHWRQPLLPIDTRRAACEYLTTNIGAGVVLVQEAVPPLEVERERALSTAKSQDTGTERSATVALDRHPDRKAAPLDARTLVTSAITLAHEHAPGSPVAIARLSVEDPADHARERVRRVDSSSVSTMLQVVADLVPLFRFAGLRRGSSLAAISMCPDRLPVEPAWREARPYSPLSAHWALSRQNAGRRSPPSPDCTCSQGDACDHIATWGGVELDHLFVTTVAGQGR